MFGRITKAYGKGYGDGHDDGFDEGYELGHKDGRKVAPEKDGDRAGQGLYDEIQPGSPLDNLYQALKQEEE